MTPSSPLPPSLAWLTRSALPACLLLTVSGCGGESTPAPESAHAASTKAAPAEKATASERDGAEEAAGESAPRASCDDGTCFECGSGTCPQGWYCDESAQGGPACSWLPDCNKKPDCGCVGKTLGSACTCAEAGGGLHVKCK